MLYNDRLNCLNCTKAVRLYRNEVKPCFNFWEAFESVLIKKLLSVSSFCLFFVEFLRLTHFLHFHFYLFCFTKREKSRRQMRFFCCVKWKEQKKRQKVVFCLIFRLAIENEKREREIEKGGITNCKKRDNKVKQS